MVKIKKDSVYRIELRHYGEIAQTVETASMSEAATVYKCWSEWDSSATILYVDEVQLSFQQADDLMGYRSAGSFGKGDGKRKRRPTKKVG